MEKKYRKLYNGINGTKRTLEGNSVHSTMKPELLARQVYAIARTEEARGADSSVRIRKKP